MKRVLPKILEAVGILDPEHPDAYGYDDLWAQNNEGYSSNNGSPNGGYGSASYPPSGDHQYMPAYHQAQPMATPLANGGAHNDGHQQFAPTPSVNHQPRSHNQPPVSNPPPFAAAYPSPTPYFDSEQQTPHLPKVPKQNLAFSNPSEVVILDIKSFEEVPKVLQQVKDRKLVIVNLNCMTAEEGQRVLDVVAGGTSIIDGAIERVSETIFIFTPQFIKITSREEDKASTHRSIVDHALPEAYQPQYWQKAS